MRLGSVLILSALLVLGGCSGGAEKKGEKAGATLAERLGGPDGIQAVVKDFVESFVAKDTRINARFAKTDLAHLEKMLSEQLEEAAGCPGVKYTGKDMKSAHAGMGIATGEFNALVEDLGKALDKHGASPADRDALLAKLAPMKDQIVEKP
jgi:hemoglobin